MNNVQLHFIHGGLYTSIQDLGRQDYQSFGIPLSGFLDRYAAKIANTLVGNHVGSPLLEITYAGPKIEISAPCQIALAGADITAKLDDAEIPLWETIMVSKPCTLHFGRLKSGCRCYLAIGGHWEIVPWLGSYSTLTYGGVPKPLHKGDEIFISPSPFIDSRSYDPDFTYTDHLHVRTLAGPEFSWFKPSSQNAFISETYTLTSHCNRMGYRLTGKPLRLKEPQELISSGIVPGTIQILKSGEPVILLADAQTTGGYPRMANIISADLDALAQLKPGDTISFTLIPLSEANQLFRARKESLKKILISK
jgi:antagonist of KipI